MTTQQQIWTDLSEVLRLVKDVADELPWASTMGYGSGSGAGERVSSSNISDSTASLATSDWAQASRRAEVVAGASVARARTEMIRAVDALVSTYGPLGSEVPTNPSKLIGPQCTDDELTAAREAQQRRHERGEIAA